KCVVYDFNGTLAPDFKKQAMAYYRARLEDALEPLVAAPDAELENELMKAGFIASERSKIGSRLSRIVLERIARPKRGTKARQVYYDLLEAALEKGAIDAKALPDALSPKSVIRKERREGWRVVALSRGTQSLLDKYLKASGLGEVIERIYSTIEFGGEKTKSAYIGCIKRLEKDGFDARRFYEDEFDNVKQMFAAGLELARERESVFPFEIVWVDRLGEIEKKKKEIGALRAEYGKAKTTGWAEFEAIFKVARDLVSEARPA
ncbi:MAG: hypothetical protein V1817_02695, partial [Candidatus Micrarchaeota archaeon]